MLIKNAILTLLVGLTLLFCTQSSELRLEEGQGVIMNSELKLEGYTFIDIEPSKVEKEQLPADTTFKKKFIYPSNVTSREEAREKMVYATIVLSGADSRSIHRPEVCLPGQGWEILSRKKVVVEIDRGGLSLMQLDLTRKDTVKGGGEQVTRAVYYYFLVGKDLATPSTMQRILISNWDNLVHNKAHRWAYPSFMSNYVVKSDGEDSKREKEMYERVIKVIKGVCPQILRKDVELK